MGVLARDQIALADVEDTSDPTPDDDSTQGFRVGALWRNTTTDEVFILANATPAVAVWRIVSTDSGSGAGAAVNPGEIMFGTLLDYGFAGSVTSGEVQFVRVRLRGGLIVSGMRTFIDSGGTASRNVRMGLYDQSVPDDIFGDPDTLVAVTNEFPTNGLNGTFKTEAFQSGDYTVPVTGFHWLAIVTDSAALKFATTNVQRSSFLPVRRESSTGTVLPATTGVLTNPVSALSYIAALEA
jgi:hypothetical protein